jgi:N-methylhydantoinase B/oxoprolinase/acetone carboxylase alpha subunit
MPLKSPNNAISVKYADNRIALEHSAVPFAAQRMMDASVNIVDSRSVLVSAAAHVVVALRSPQMASSIIH